MTGNMETDAATLLANLEAANVVAEPETVVVEPVEPVVEAVVEPVVPAVVEPVPPVVEEDETKATDRFRTKSWDEVDALAATITAQSKGKIPLKEALAQAEQMLGKAVAEPEAVVDPITALETERAEIKARLDKVAEDESVYTKAIRDDQAREQELLLEIRDAKAAKAQTELQQAQAADTEFDAEWQADIADAVKEFGEDAMKDEGAIGRAMLTEFDLAAKDPAHRYHRQWKNGTLSPLDVARHVAARDGIAPVTKAAAAAVVAAPVVVPPVARVFPASGGARPAPVPVQNAATVQAAQRERIVKAGGDANALAAVFQEALGGAVDVGIRMA